MAKIYPFPKLFLPITFNWAICQTLLLYGIYCKMFAAQSIGEITLSAVLSFGSDKFGKLNIE